MKKAILTFNVLVLFTFTSAFADFKSKCFESNLSRESDLNHVEIVLIVQLEEGKVDGNWGIRKKNAEIKKEVSFTKRVHTRYDLKLRGKLIKALKGKPQLIHDKERAAILTNGGVEIVDTGPEVEFNILMKYIGFLKPEYQFLLEMYFVINNPFKTERSCFCGNGYFCISRYHPPV